MADLINTIPLESIEDFILEIEEAEGLLLMLAELCGQAEEPEFCSQGILQEVSKFLSWYLDRSRSARHYFLRRGHESYLKQYGLKGELKKLEEKYRN